MVCITGVGMTLYAVFIGSIWILHGLLFGGWGVDALIIHYAQFLALWLVVGSLRLYGF